jgi:hypothetical protein
LDAVINSKVQGKTPPGKTRVAEYIFDCSALTVPASGKVPTLLIKKFDHELFDETNLKSVQRV